MKNIYSDLRSKLLAAGIDNPDLEAKFILKDVLNASDADMITGAINPSSNQTARIAEIVKRRAGGEPLSRIQGYREFWGLKFKLGPGTLDPRPDSETIIDIAVKTMRDNPPARILDLGTGTGCLVIALLHEFPHATGVAVDVSCEALEVAGENARSHGVEGRLQLIESDWAANIGGRFDLIVSNPPYIANPVIATLSKEVQNHDPILALSGGDDGLDAYRSILTEIDRLCATHGKCLFEIGFDQRDDITRLVGESGFSVVGVHPDLAGNPRVVEIARGDN